MSSNAIRNNMQLLPAGKPVRRVYENSVRCGCLDNISLPLGLSEHRDASGGGVPGRSGTERSGPRSATKTILVIWFLVVIVGNNFRFDVGLSIQESWG
jgi:hypothetical protein